MYACLYECACACMYAFALHVCMHAPSVCMDGCVCYVTYPLYMIQNTHTHTCLHIYTHKLAHRQSQTQAQTQSMDAYIYRFLCVLEVCRWPIICNTCSHTFNAQDNVHILLYSQSNMCKYLFLNGHGARFVQIHMMILL